MLSRYVSKSVLQLLSSIFPAAILNPSFRQFSRAILKFPRNGSSSYNYHKWKNHFSEMKGDVGMSLHEKEGEQEDAYTETGSH